jgi:DNA-binding NarL/FixJ family response regulator
MASARPDTVLLDLNVGAQNSTTALPAIRRLAPDARIIVHTADIDGAHADGAIRLGADLVLEKATVSVDQVVEAALRDDPR